MRDSQQSGDPWGPMGTRCPQETKLFLKSFFEVFFGHWHDKYWQWLIFPSYPLLSMRTIHIISYDLIIIHINPYYPVLSIQWNPVDSFIMFHQWIPIKLRHSSRGLHVVATAQKPWGEALDEIGMTLYIIVVVYIYIYVWCMVDKSNIYILYIYTNTMILKYIQKMIQIASPKLFPESTKSR